MLLKTQEINFLAGRGSWYVDVDLKHQDFKGDTYVVTGFGTEDLNRLLGLMQAHPNGKFVVDVGTQYSSYKACDVEDIVALKSAFCTIWGTVARPAPREDFIDFVAFQPPR